MLAPYSIPSSSFWKKSLIYVANVGNPLAITLPSFYTQEFILEKSHMNVGSPLDDALTILNIVEYVLLESLSAW